MKLLRVDSVLAEDSPLELEEFIGDDIPRYAILSHTWAKDEVLYQHVLDNTARQRRGFLKVKFTAKQAQGDYFDYIWVDTCCIDKSSSAVLQEAINSMYAWYSKAEICYAYLSDVTIAADTPEGIKQFVNSRWFTRGWTLQELLAPSLVKFYSAGWDLIGVRSPLLGFKYERSLHEEISEATGISQRWVRGEDVSRATIAERMSWASSRNTTRIEDIAYSLLGIFDVNMPLLYGEGSKAFRRLQEKIMKQSDDHTIFAWTRRIPGGIYVASGSDGLLASSPEDFSMLAQAKVQFWRKTGSLSPFLMTNKGLQIKLPLRRLHDNIFLAALDCTWTDTLGVGLFLQGLPNDNKGRYVRVWCERLARIEPSTFEEPETVYVSQRTDLVLHRSAPSTWYHFRAYNSQGTRKHFEVTGASPSWLSKQAKLSLPSRKDWIFRQDILCNDKALAAAVSYRHETSHGKLLVMFGHHHSYGIVFDARPMREGTKDEEDWSERPNWCALATTFHPHVPGEALEVPGDYEDYFIDVKIVDSYITESAQKVTIPQRSIDTESEIESVSDIESEGDVTPKTETLILEVDLRRVESVRVKW